MTRTFKIRAQEHTSYPPFLKIGKSRLDVRFVLGQSCKYSFDDGYAGWNKLVSIRFSTWKRNAFSIGWRYNSVSGLFQIAPFASADGKDIFPLTNYISVAPDVAIEASLFEENKKLFLVSDRDVLYY